MDEIVAKPEVVLYEACFYAWTREQAALLRSGRLAGADIANLLEEIESLGRKEVADLRSHLQVLARHLLKEIVQPDEASRSQALTIGQRQDLRWLLRDNPSLRPRASEIFAQAYADAREVVASETGLPLEDVSGGPPFTYEEAIDEAFWPGRPLDDRT